ncbi:unnamed protein product [Diatraea saccharalis]|uniref:LITAF domain-containing protein n=1 Tax=Diatraea saccharalis TaxID=40085 RepID=A0A9N9R935_9NEOP|nr:unnamed protein product [Diatraea saccharalis]
MAEKSMPSDPSSVSFVNNQPPPPPYSGTQAGPSTVTYVAATPVVVPVAQVQIVRSMGHNSSSYICRSCNMNIMTRTQVKANTKTHLFALLLCVLGLWPCVCIPYCVDSCQSVDHYCPNCNAYIGVSN